jgi:hypothetical protein
MSKKIEKANVGMWTRKNMKGRNEYGREKRGKE